MCTESFEDNVDDRDDLDGSYSIFNQREDLILIVFTAICKTPYKVLVYDIINNKEIVIPLTEDADFLHIELVSTTNEDLVFICDQTSTNLKVYQIDNKKNYHFTKFWSGILMRNLILTEVNFMMVILSMKYNRSHFLLQMM